MFLLRRKTLQKSSTRSATDYLPTGITPKGLSLGAKYMFEPFKRLPNAYTDGGPRCEVLRHCSLVSSEATRANPPSNSESLTEGRNDSDAAAHIK